MAEKEGTDMDIRGQRLLLVNFVVVMGLVAVGMVHGADTGKLTVRTDPGEADIYLDGNHVGDASRGGKLKVGNVTAGEHTLGVFKYGYSPQTTKVTVEAGKKAETRVRLEPIGGTLPGPWGRLTIIGAKHGAILVNGKTPEYVVGHGAQTVGKKRQLVLPPGTYQVTVTQEKELWSGSVTVAANQETIVDVGRNTQRTADWPAGKTLADLPRYSETGGVRRIALAPVNGQFAAEPAQVSCGDSSHLKWAWKGAVRTEISGIGEVPASGDREVSPKQTTTYTLTATGPGGVATLNATLDVNKSFNTSMEVVPQEIRYRKIGDKVVEQGSATLNWSTERAESVAIDPLGTVEGSGSRKLQPVPKQTQVGPVNETVTYTLKATNACGGEETRTATLHLVGAIEPAISATEAEFNLALASIFFPTDYPEKQRPQGGLLKSQQASLARLATTFKKYLEYDPAAHLALEGHADNRASPPHDQELSERRVARAKDFLVGQGIAAGAIETSAFGKTQQSSRDEVKQLETQNPNPPPKARARAGRTDWLAYNRRVDIVLKPSGQRSSKYYPHTAADSNILWQEPKPRWTVVEKNQ